MDIRLKHTPALYLTGFMGCGKSTIGRMLAEHLGWDFVDLDQEIERAEERTIPQLFEEKGVEEFRRIETELLRQWIRKADRGMPYIFALGGGTFAEPGNPEMLEHHGVSIWLDCPLETIEARLEQSGRESRPLAADPDLFRELYEKRRTAYARAHYRIDAACSPHEAVTAIEALPLWK